MESDTICSKATWDCSSCYQIQGHDQELIFPLLPKDNLEPLRPGPTPVAPE